MALIRHNVYAGSETGIFKGVNTFKISFENLNNLSELNKEKAINVMCWRDKEQTQICTGLRNGIVNVYDTDKEKVIKSYSLGTDNNLFTGMAMCGRKLVTCLENGTVTVWKKSEALKTFRCGNKASRMRQNSTDENIILTGGEESELKVWDLNDTSKPVFEAKNVKNDFLGLRVPVWVTDMGYMHDGRRIAVSTRHHQVRLYDPASGMRRPVIDVSVEDYPFTSLAVTNREECLLVGSSHGRMLLFDIRKKDVVKRFKGFAGSIQDIACHPILPVVASCSIDRFVRIHDVNNAQLISKIYVKSRVSCLLLRRDYEIATKESEVKKEEVDSDEYDELWDKMPAVVDRKRPKGDKGQSLKRKLKKTE